jgi:hypothetical protein
VEISIYLSLVATTDVDADADVDADGKHPRTTRSWLLPNHDADSFMMVVLKGRACTATTTAGKSFHSMRSLGCVLVQEQAGDDDDDDDETDAEPKGE